MRSTLYLSPIVSPVTSSGDLIVGDSLKVVINGAAIDPIINLIVNKYAVRIVGTNYQTEFNFDLATAPTGSTVQAIDYKY